MKIKYHFIASTIIFFCVMSSCVPKEVQKNPNIILLMTDDQGWFDVGFNGNKSIHTPNLDALAGRGVILDRFYSASAECSPTRASVLTGRNPLRMNIPTANEGHLREEEITLPEILKKNGYLTKHIGKWHLGTLSKTQPDANRGGRLAYLEDYSIPTMHGFDGFFSTESKVPTYDPMIAPTSYREDESLTYGWREIKNKDSSTTYGTAYWEDAERQTSEDLAGDDSKIIMDRVVDFVSTSVVKGMPFFTTVWLHTPHLPLVCEDKYRDYYTEHDLETQLYNGSISAFDDQIGRLWSELENRGIQDNTMIWFCSDNGPSKISPGSTGGLRGKKQELYEGGVRVPAFVVWPKELPAGMRSGFPCVTSDYLPTVLDVLELPSLNRPIDGISIIEAIKDKDTQRDSHIGFLLRRQLSWVDDQYKLISMDSGRSFQLYDLVADRKESRDISAENGIIAEKMKKQLAVWMESIERSKQGKDYVLPENKY